MTEPAAETATPPRKAWFERAPINLGELAVETIAVVIGILLALAIDGWFDARKDRETVDSALQSIRAEIARNREAALKHQRHLDAMAAAMERDNPADAAPRPCSAWKGWMGIQEPMLLDTSYNVAIVTQALAKMPFAQASRIGEIYGGQHYVEKVYDKLGGILLNDRPMQLANCVGISRELSRGSGSLAERYQSLLQPTSPP